MKLPAFLRRRRRRTPDTAPATLAATIAELEQQLAARRVEVRSPIYPTPRYADGRKVTAAAVKSAARTPTPPTRRPNRAGYTPTTSSYDPSPSFAATAAATSYSGSSSSDCGSSSYSDSGSCSF
ncbi:hypothetical protein ACWEQ4_00860 [Rhodococcus sp. NPDC003994]